MNIYERCRLLNLCWWYWYGGEAMKEKEVMRKKWCEKFGYVAEDFDCEGCRRCEG